MTFTLDTYEHYCTEDPEGCGGEVLSGVDGGAILVRKIALRDAKGRIAKQFRTRDEALAWADKGKHVVTNR